MRKVIYVHPIDGKQRMAQLGEGGEMSSDCQIVWDEAVDGPLSDVLRLKVGALVRKGRGLEVDPTMEAAMDAEALKREQFRVRMAQARNLLMTADLSVALTSAETLQLVKALVLVYRGE